MSFEISLFTRWMVKTRSQGLCERCQRRKAIHMHHLTYERAGNERPEDLQHICLCCHIKLHPRHAKEILAFEDEKAKGRLEEKTGFEDFKVKRREVKTPVTIYEGKRDNLMRGKKDSRRYTL